MPGLQDILDKARRVVLRKGVEAQDADDVVQEAYLRVRAYEQGQAVRSREALLITAAVNLSFDQNRRRKHAPFVAPTGDHLSAVDEAPLPDQAYQSRRRLERLNEGVGRLPERTRRILLARRLDGKSFKDIAAAESMTVAAVEKQVARATLELMKWMDGW